MQLELNLNDICLAFHYKCSVGCSLFKGLCSVKNWNRMLFWTSVGPPLFTSSEVVYTTVHSYRTAHKTSRSPKKYLGVKAGNIRFKDEKHTKYFTKSKMIKCFLYTSTFFAYKCQDSKTCAQKFFGASLWCYELFCVYTLTMTHICCVFA